MKQTVSPSEADPAYSFRRASTGRRLCHSASDVRRTTYDAQTRLVCLLALAGFCCLPIDRAAAQSSSSTASHGVSLAPWTGPPAAGVASSLPSLTSGAGTSAPRKNAPPARPPAPSSGAASTPAPKPVSAPSPSSAAHTTAAHAASPTAPSKPAATHAPEPAKSVSTGRRSADAPSIPSSAGKGQSAATPPSPPNRTLATNALSEARPDLANPTAGIPSGQLQESPTAALGGAWKMLVYLVPMLLVMVGCLHLLRRFQRKSGRTPSAFTSVSAGSRRASGRSLGALLSSFSLPQAHRPATGSIRVVETLPLGAAQLHLIEVRGRMLLVSAAGAQVSLLSTLDIENDSDVNGFRSMLNAAAHDIDALEFSGRDLPSTEAVAALESALQRTGQSVQRRLHRLRTVSEEEALYEQE